ncbi:hypothetical protein ACM66B_005057 [Microbotryomycetes sp. NB124-2]
MDALEKGFLEKLVLAIYLDPDQPNDIVEAYTFTFKYHVDAGGQRRADMDIRDRLGNLFLTSFANTSRPTQAMHVNAFRRQIHIISYTHTLDTLPWRRFVSLRLFYNEGTPDDYQPPRFHHVDPDKVRYFASTMHMEDEPDCAVIGHAGSLFHTVSVHTFSVAGQLGPSAASESLPKDENTKHNIEAAGSRKVLWDAEKLVLAVTDDLDKIQKPEAIGVRTQTGGFREMDDVMADPELEKLRMQVGLQEGVFQVIYPQGKREAAIFAPAQSDNEILERVLRETDPELHSQEPTQTQPAKPRKFPLESPGAAKKRQATKQQRAPTAKISSSPKSQQPPALRRSTREQTLPATQTIKSQNSKKLKKQQKTGVVCECGDPDEDGCMVECSNVFVCYGCRFKLSSIDALLDVAKQNATNAVLQDLQGLALYRRALAVVLEHKEVTIAQFKSWLSVDAATAKMLVQRLKTEGLLQDWQDTAAKKGKGSTNKLEVAHKQIKYGTFMSVLSEEQRKVAKAKYFVPGGGQEEEITAVLERPAAGESVEDSDIEPDTVEDATGQFKSPPPAQLRGRYQNMLEDDPIESDDDSPLLANSHQQDRTDAQSKPNAANINKSSEVTMQEFAKYERRAEQHQLASPPDETMNDFGHPATSFPSPAPVNAFISYSAPAPALHHSDHDAPSLPLKRPAAAAVTQDEDDHFSEPDTVDGVESINMLGSGSKEVSVRKKRKVSEAERIEA